jgi:hypothetical protein
MKGYLDKKRGTSFEKASPTTLLLYNDLTPISKPVLLKPPLPQTNFFDDFYFFSRQAVIPQG